MVISPSDQRSSLSHTTEADAILANTEDQCEKRGVSTEAFEKDHQPAKEHPQHPVDGYKVEAG